MATLEQLGAEKYVLLTTFRKDGRAVSTPIWVMPDGPGVSMWTVADSGKVKRIRNGGRVTLQACDIRGNVTGDDVVEGNARLGDRSDFDRVAAALHKKYGIVGRLSMIGSRIRRGPNGSTVILVS